MSGSSGNIGGHLPLACNLSGPEQQKRGGEMERIFEGCSRTDELKDGYEFSFPGSEVWAVRLTEFVVFERACCPFFAFELVFEPDGGPIWLRVRGPEGIVAGMFASRVG